MRRFRATALGLALTAGLVGAALADAPPPEIPVGIKVPVVLTGTYSSETAHVGDPFTFKTKMEQKLGDLDVPAGTPGHGRLAVVVKAQGKQHGNLSLQADSIDLPAHTIWVNIDTDKPPTGRLSKRHTTPVLLPFVGAVVQTTSGDLVLDSGIPFGVVTILPRRAPAPLLTAPPTPEPSPPPGPAAKPAMTPAPATGTPAAMPGNPAPAAPSPAAS